MANKVVGVLGGMGPEATVDFMGKVIRATPAKNDQEHIRLLIDNNPQTPSRVEAILHDGPSPGPVMAEMARGLKEWGAEVLAIPCNTAHFYIQEVVDAVDIPVLNMIEETIKIILANGLKNIALLATSATLKTGLYETKLRQAGINVILPTEEYQQKTMAAIFAVKGGDYLTADQEIAQVLKHIRERGADGVILGCTELPLVITEKNCELVIFDPTNVLAEAVVAMACGVEE